MYSTKSVWSIEDVADARYTFQVLRRNGDLEVLGPGG